MKYLDGQYYVKDHRYKIHRTEVILLRKLDPPLSLGTHYEVQNKTQIRRNQKVIKNDNDELIVENYPKNNKRLFNNQNINHLIVLVVNKING